MRSRSAGAYPRRSAIVRPISKWNSPCGFSATLRYIALTLDSSSLGSKLMIVAMSYLLVWQLATGRCWLSEAERRGASLDQFVYFAGPGDLDPIDEIAL